MGFYYCTVICVGFYIKNNTDIKENITLPQNIEILTDNEGTLYYITYTFIKKSDGFGSRVLDESDLSRGYVLLSEAKDILKFSDEVQIDDIINLKNLEKQLYPEYKIGSYLVEYIISTLDTQPNFTNSLIMSII